MTVLYTTGRASSVFFQGLFDGHPEVITLPAFYDYVDSWLVYKTPEQIISSIYNSEIVSSYRAHLGLSSDINYDFFKKYFMEYLNNFGISRKTIFVGTQYAISKIRNKDLSKIKYVLHQPHMFSSNLTRSKKNILFLKDFNPEKYIFLIRDPRATFLSTKKLSFFPTDFHSKLAFYNWKYDYDFYKLISRNRSVLTVKHEDLHLAFSEIKKSILDFLKIDDASSLSSSTFYGFPYDGKYGTTNRQGIFKNVPSPDYVKDDWKRILSKDELFFLQKIFKNYFLEFNYELYHSSITNEAKLSFRKRLSDYLKVNEKGVLSKIAKSINYFSGINHFEGFSETCYNFLVFLIYLTLFTRTRKNILILKVRSILCLSPFSSDEKK